MPNVANANSSDGIGARGFALIVIVALAFAVRADIDPSSQNHAYSGAAIAGAIGAILSVLLNFASNHFAQLKNLNVRERWLISTYSSIILVMVFFVFFDTFLTGYVWYDLYSRFVGPSIVPTVLAIVVTFLFLLFKSRVFDKNKFGIVDAVYNFIVVLASGGIVYIVSVMGNDLFQRLFQALLGRT